MNIKSNAVLHNRFDIVARDANTSEVKQRGQAENIVLDRMYTRLCNFQTYFTNIVFGTGTGTPTASRTTLFNRIGYKVATNEEIVRSYPTSKWVRKIRLESSEYNGNTITEVGISEDTTSVNTHALITDAEGNPLSIVKNDLTVIDIYATVFIEIPNIDGGLYYINNGWRDYLTGSGVPNNLVSISTTQSDETNTQSKYTQTATKTVDTTNKRVKIATRIEVDKFNKDIQFVDWVGVGLRCKLPRVGIFEGKQKNNVQIGVGDGVKTKFPIPNLLIENLSNVTVDDVVASNWILNDANEVEFDSPVGNSLVVKGSYKSLLIPKDSNNVLDIEMTIQYDNLGSLPTPIYTADFSDVHGNKTVIAGTSNYGFFGEVSAIDFISGNDLATLIGLTAGTAQNSDAGWLKVIDGNKMLLIAKKTFRNTISWDNINAVGAVFGKIVTIDGVKYILRLLSSAEWNRFMYPLHTSHPNSAPNWASYSNVDLHIATGDGRLTWTSTPSSSDYMAWGNYGVDNSVSLPPSDFGGGWRPVLEVLI